MFYLGQKVVCVHPTPSGSLKKNKVYTITWVGKGDLNCPAVRVFEAKPAYDKKNFHAWRFKPVVDDFGKRVAEEIEKEINRLVEA